MLDVWSSPRVDPLRIKRLLIGACAGGILILSGGYGAAMYVHEDAPPIEKKKKEKIIDNIALVDEPGDGGGGEPPPANTPPSPTPPRPAPRPVVQPKRVVAKASFQYSDDKPVPGTGRGTGPGHGNGTGSGYGGGGPVPSPPPPPAPPPPPEPPKPKARPKPNPADYDAPKCRRRGIDAGRAKALGIEGRVIVSYTVTTSGAVTNVKVVSGPPELGALAVSAVQGWTCEPARMKADGSPIAITKKVPLSVTLE